MLPTPKTEQQPPSYDSETAYVYVFVRLDLPSPEQICVQACHAALELGRRQPYDETDLPHPHLVLVGVKDARRLRKLVREDIVPSDLAFEVWKEPDLRNQVTAVAVGPVRGQARALFSRWKTLRLPLATT